MGMEWEGRGIPPGDPPPHSKSLDPPLVLYVEIRDLFRGAMPHVADQPSTDAGTIE